MRILKVSIFGLTLMAGACGVSETSRQSSSTPPNKSSSITTDRGGPIEAPVIDIESPLPKKVPSPPKESKDEAVKRDLQQLQGRWIAVDIEHDGGKETPTGGLKWVIQDDTYEVWIDNKKLEICNFTLNPTKRPKTIETRNSLGGSKGRRLTGIYELDGDTFKLCYDITGQGYPKEYSAPKAARRIFYVFRRER